MFCPNPECPDLEGSKTPSEYVDGITKCPICGTWLVDQMPKIQSPADQPDSEMDNTDIESSNELTDNELTEELVVVASFNYRQDADLAMTFLNANGIEVFESGDDLGGWNPGLGFASRTRLLVHKSNAEKAIALLDDVKNPE
ncbi:MAG: hypothetical protein LAO31_16510 [Acidobacteriia bacterium]|nr:hypothetical protein [Terriglobia bacterium]